MFKFKAAHALGALLCAAATPASAAVITQTGSVYDAPIRINQFSAPGTLTSVTYSVKYGLGARLGNMNPVDVEAPYNGYVGTLDFGFIAFGGIATLAASSETFVSGSGTAVGEITYGLSRFIGRDQYQSDTNYFFDFIAEGVSFMGSTTSASYEISYVYDEAVGAIPEPGTWALMLLGFSMIGYAMRRRKLAFA